MALSHEDKKDIGHHFGKKHASKMADATRDHSGKLRAKDKALKSKVSGKSYKAKPGYAEKSGGIKPVIKGYGRSTMEQRLRRSGDPGDISR